MRSGFRSAQLFFFALPIFTAACGGGGGAGGVQPPLPTPDFSISVSSSSVSVTQGSTSAPINVSITPQNSFAGSVRVSIRGLPTGVSTNPASPFSVPSGQSVAVLFGAASNAQTGQFNLTAQGTSGTPSHSQNLTLAIQAMPPSNLPRTRFVETDFVTAVDTPSGQPHRRHIVYDANTQRFFVANLAMNRVEVFAAGTRRCRPRSQRREPILRTTLRRAVRWRSGTPLRPMRSRFPQQTIPRRIWSLSGMARFSRCGP